MDYSFETWNDYYTFLTNCLKSDFISDTYLVYKYENDNYRYCDINMINFLLNKGLDPQEGFNGFIYALIEGYKHAYLMEDDMQHIFKIFINKGATTPLYLLFNPNYSYINKIEFLEDEIINYNVRGMIIDILSKITKIDVAKYGKWRSIKSMNLYSIINYERNIDYETGRLMILKYNSKYLQTNPRPMKFKIEI